MNDILEIRMWWSFGLIMFGFVLPFIVICFTVDFTSKKRAWGVLLAFIVYGVLFMNYSRELIPEKYDVETIKVKKCITVEKIVPKYPDGVVEK